MPSAVVLRSKTAITNPIPGTPRLPNIDAGVLFDWDPETLSGADGSTVTALPSSRGSLGTAGDLSVVTSGTVTLGVSPGEKKALILGSGSLATPYFASPLTAPLTVVAVAQSADPTQAARYVFSGGTGGYASMTFRGIGFGQPNQLNFGAVPTANTDVALVGVFNGSASVTQINGASQTTGTTGGNANAQAPRFILGSNTSATASANLIGRVQRVIAYNRVLTPVELGLLDDYLTGEYAL